MYLVRSYNGLDVSYLPELDGGGNLLWPSYVQVVRKMFGKVEHIHEWCAGPGFIGFSLLAHGLCDKLSLSDINPRAIAALRETVRANNLESRVSVYESDVLAGIPADGCWDLVVGNPPHHRVGGEHEYQSNICGNDPDWRIHRAFYGTVARFLKPSGSVLLVENYDGSSESDFTTLLDDDSGLDFVGSFMFRAEGETATPAFGGLDRFYYFWTRRNPRHSPDRQFLWDDGGSVETLGIRLARLEEPGEPIAARAYQRYKIDFANDTPMPLSIGLISQQKYCWPFPLPLKVATNTRIATGVLTFEPGEYRLVHIDPKHHARDVLWRKAPPVEHVTLAVIRSSAAT